MKTDFKLEDLCRHLIYNWNKIGLTGKMKYSEGFDKYIDLIEKYLKDNEK
jgi:hypothetical protein